MSSGSGGFSVRMKTSRLERTSPPVEFAAAAIVFVMIFGLTLLGAHFYARAAREDARAAATALASELRARCDDELNSVVYLSSGLNAYFIVKDGHLDDAEIGQMLSQLYASSRHVRNFGVAVGYVLRYVYPSKGNEAAIGLDYRSLPLQLPAVQAAIDRHEPTLSPAIRLVQGGEGVIYRSPIYIHHQYWGLLSTVIDIEDLLQSSFKGLADADGTIALRQVADSHQLLWGDPAVFDDPDVQRLETRFGWEIGVRPVLGRNTSLVTGSLCGAGALLGLMVAGSLLATLRSRRELRAASALKMAILDAAGVSITAVTPEGVFTHFNKAAERMLGYSAEEMVGRQTAGILHDPEEVEARAKALSQELGYEVKPGLEAYVARVRRGVTDEGRWTYIRKDGSRFPVLLSLTAIRDEKSTITGYIGIASDISELEQKSLEIRQALREKETLLKEVYHRVKNNLQVITSLFSLQARTLPDGPAREALREGAERVLAMALVHEKLYQSSTLSSIDVGDYVKTLCHDLAAASGMEAKGIRIHTAIDAIQIGLETAVPLGLLMNELISNSLKHAFPEGRTGEIRVGLKRLDESTGLLEIADSGVGYPESALKGRTQSLGLKLIETLSRQLDGELSLENREGAFARLQFRLPEATPLRG